MTWSTNKITDISLSSDSIASSPSKKHPYKMNLPRPLNSSSAPHWKILEAMATPGYCIAEAYVARKLHSGKLKRVEEERAKIDDGEKQPSGCFLSIFKKVHPAQTVLERRPAGNEAQRLDSKG